MLIIILASFIRLNAQASRILFFEAKILIIRKNGIELKLGPMRRGGTETVKWALLLSFINQ